MKPTEMTANLGVVLGTAQLPTYGGSVNGRTAKRLVRDTGATMSQVHPRFVGKKFKNEGWLLVTRVHISRSLPTTIVTLKINGAKTRTRMVVNRKLDYDVLMGNDIPDIDATLDRTSIRRQPQRSCTRPVNYNESSETDDSSISILSTQTLAQPQNLSPQQPQNLSPQQTQTLSPQQTQTEETDRDSTPLVRIPLSQMARRRRTTPLPRDRRSPIPQREQPTWKDPETARPGVVSVEKDNYTPTIGENRSLWREVSGN